MSRSMLK